MATQAGAIWILRKVVWIVSAIRFVSVKIDSASFVVWIVSGVSAFFRM